MTDKEFINGFSQNLFWDADISAIDVQAHAGYIVARVLEYGRFEDWRRLVSFYGMKRIVAEAKDVRSLNPKSLAYLCLVSKTNKEDYRCYTTRQSDLGLWSY